MGWPTTDPRGSEKVSKGRAMAGNCKPAGEAPRPLGTPGGDLASKVQAPSPGCHTRAPEAAPTVSPGRVRAPGAWGAQ